jgi:hypothetical protein
MQRLTANSGLNTELTTGVSRTILNRRLNRSDAPASAETEYTLETTPTT